MFGEGAAAVDDDDDDDDDYDGDDDDHHHPQKPESSPQADAAGVAIDATLGGDECPLYDGKMSSLKMRMIL